MAVQTLPFLLFLSLGASLGHAASPAVTQQATPPDAARKEAQPILREVFQRQFTEDQLAQFGEKPLALKDLAGLMSPEQKEGARARLRELEAGSAAPADLEQIADGYLLLASSKDAVRISSRLLEEYPENSRAYHLASEAQYNLRNYPAAAEAAKAALAINPDDLVARGLWMSTKDRIDASKTPLPSDPLARKEGVGSSPQGQAGIGYSALPSVVAKSVLANLPTPPAPVSAEPIPKDASIATIAKAAFFAAATATGGLLLFMGLGAGKLEEKFPNIRRNMGIAAGIGGAIAVSAISLPTLAPLLTASKPVIEGTGTVIAASKTPQGQRATSSALSTGQRWVNQAGQSVARLLPKNTQVLDAEEEFAERGWRLGDPILKRTARGNLPSWSAQRARFWKNEVLKPETLEKYGTENVERMRKGLAPQRLYRGRIESMDLSHEPIPKRFGGTDVVPRWPEDHAKVDSFRRLAGE